MCVLYVRGISITKATEGNYVASLIYETGFSLCYDLYGNLIQRRSEHNIGFSDQGDMKPNKASTVAGRKMLKRFEIIFESVILECAV